MRLLVCGSREWDDYTQVYVAMDEIRTQMEVTRLIHGGCRGPDLWAARYFKHAWPENVKIEEYAVDYKKDGSWPGAGPRRNARMFNEDAPDLVLAFWDGKSRGTLSMIQIAARGGVPVRIVPERPEGSATPRR